MEEYFEIPDFDDDVPCPLSESLYVPPVQEVEDQLIEYYRDEAYGIGYPEARVLARRFPQRLHVRYIDKAAEFVEGRRRGPQVSLAIRFFKDGEMLFTVGDKHKRGPDKGKWIYPGVYWTKHSPLRRPVVNRKDGHREVCEWIRFMDGEAVRIV